MKQKNLSKMLHCFVLHFGNILYFSLNYIKHSDNEIMEAELVCYNKQIFLKLLPLRYFPQNGVTYLQKYQVYTFCKNSTLSNKPKFTPVILIHCSYYTFICIPLLFLQRKTTNSKLIISILLFFTLTKIIFYTKNIVYCH